MKTCALFIFSWDLRLHDAPGLLHTLTAADEIIFAVEPIQELKGPHAYESQAGPVSNARRRFITESQNALAAALHAHGHPLIRLSSNVVSDLQTLIHRYRVRSVFRHTHPGTFERWRWQQLRSRCPEVHFQEIEGRTLFRSDALPFDVNQIPASFSAFRRKVEKLPIPDPAAPPSSLPPPPPTLEPFATPVISPAPSYRPAVFAGGEEQALAHLQRYFSGNQPRTYKQTRNALDDWDSSTKLSPWLAAGCLSPRKALAALKEHESQQGANESTYWIFFELLWREYFQWLAHSWQDRMFRFRGNKPTAPLTSFYAQRFSAWKQGQTPWPIINACMNQLRQTGYMSNRGRQLVASCFVHELQLDWRYGAAYFEQQLIDYDAASNWGNWQYLAGVGVDPRGHRKFDLQKQAETYDPDGAFVERWQGRAKTQGIDNVDCADWPLDS